MSEKQFTIVGLGEVLWDVLPTGKQLGGAPANFAYVSDQLGNHGIIASRIGIDENGKEILQSLEKIGVDVSHIQQDPEHLTGTVKVSLQNGQPSYEIIENVAWDFLELTDHWRAIAADADAVCFGTLAQRNAVSQNTIREFINLTKKLRVFDVNLRQDYFSVNVLRSSLNLANVVKLNHEELPIIAKMFEIKDEDLLEQAKTLLLKFDLKLICVTRGAKGSVLITKKEVSENAGLRIQVRDTIGAGDAFTAGMIHGIVRGWNLSEINGFANKVGAYVASQTGAMPDFPSVF